MLDPTSLRVALSAVAATLLVLSYVAVYRRTRSRYSGWWVLSLLATGGSSALYSLNGTAVQAFANPIANGIAVAGGTLTWAAARSLRGTRMPWARATIPTVATLAISFADDPAGNVWAGGGALLMSLAITLTLAAREMATVRRDHRARGGRDAAPEADRALTALKVGVTILATLYWLRTVLFVGVGPDHDAFTLVLGTVPTTLALIVALVVVTFTMTELSQVERMRELEIAATRDSLTGLWNRGAFVTRASERLARGRRGHALVVADLDHFKAVNDRYGHEAGDTLLQEFARAVDRALGPRDLAGRLGGEEFALLLATDDPMVARARVEALRAEYGAAAVGGASVSPTVSFGIAMVRHGDGLSDALRRADAAMYRAKDAGRDRAVLDGHA